MITVLMSVYNGEDYLVTAIESILLQSYQNFSFIIVNDASTDSSLDIIKNFQRSSDKIILINNKKNIGLTKSLNIALKEVQSKYVARQDCDDISDIHRFEKQLNFMETHPEIKLLGTRYNEIDETGRIMGPQSLRFIKESKDIRKNILRFNPFAHGSVMIRTDILKEMNGYNELFLFAQDYELWLRILNDHNACNLDDELMSRRVTQNIISIKNLDKQRAYVVKAKLKYLRRIRLTDCFFLLKDIARIAEFRVSKKLWRRHD
ncbi:MAG: hypothetical protein A2Y40_08490 [Candidatus Margulisbacteria bacterium GWF2_35_9]|nr:MAG: hypothetical protein A2Y40_08490 [Candidatus Margulisbacteria bacterium GWF2_35_9]